MRNDELFGQAVTEAYAHMIKSKVQEKFPDFYFEKGAIIYDYNSESYVCIGYSDEEVLILQNIAKNLEQR